MTGVTVTRAELSRLPDAWAIVTEYFDAVSVVLREDFEEFSHTYFGGGSGVWLADATAEAGEMVAGCIALKPLPRFPASGEVKRLYVRPAWRGRGIADALLNGLHDYADAWGYEWLYLDSKDDLDVALRFYRNRGYIDCERYNDNPQATVFMRRRLGSK